MKDLFVIGGVVGVLSIVIRGFTSIKSAIIEWLASVLVALIIGSAIKDYVLSEGLYNASVATSSFFGIYLIKGLEKIAQNFKENPCSIIDWIRGVCKK